MATEIPEYQVVRALADDIELRDYPSVIVAETDVSAASDDKAGNSGFRVLADYIFGNNQRRAEIAMTAPVEQRRQSQKIAMTAPVEQKPTGTDSWVVTFTMPSKWTLETLPMPNNPRVRIRELPARQIAVARFSGTWSTKRFERYRDALLAAVEGSGLTIAGEPWTARYDPPWTPWFMRRNEVMVEIAR